MPIRSVPGTASIATPADGKLFAPSAARNFEPLCDLLDQVAPDSGRALELASGTGQHIVGYAARFPDLSWHPSEADPNRIASINSYIEEAPEHNLTPALQLDACSAGWSRSLAPVDLIVLSNLLHLISATEAQVLIREAAQALKPGGRFIIYGPFMRAGELTSPGDKSFHASLKGHDPEIGYKDDFDVLDWCEDAGLIPHQVVEMPANNLALVLERA